MATISIRNVTKSYGAVQVIPGLSLDIDEGEFVILVGPSGCGKSTLLRMIAGLENITSGEVHVDGLVVNKLPPRKRNIAMVFQSYALYPHKTVRKNMAFSLQMAGAGKDEIEEKVAAAAKILDIEPLLERKPGQLSGGQRQRVAMGRAIVRDPKLFLFDEPLSNLDAKLRGQMRAEIKQLHRRLKTTTVYVTHDQVEAMTMADRIVVMNAGEIEQMGTPMELYDKPQTRFVAAFIGSPAMNLIDGTLQPDGTFNAEDGTIIELNGAIAPDTQQRDITLGFRPEALSMSATEDDVSIDGATVQVIEPTGSEMLLTLSMGGTIALMLERARLQVSVGDSLDLRLAKNSLHFFDGQSGHRVA